MPPEVFAKPGEGGVLDRSDAYFDTVFGLWRLYGVMSGTVNSPVREDPVVWITKDNRAWEIPKMETTHIRNCIANILIGNIKGRGAYMPLLTAELERRNNQELDHEQHEPDPVQPGDGGTAES